MLSIVIFLGLAVSAYSQSQDGQSAASRDYSSGKTLYGSKCQFCHGVRGDGNSPAASALNPKPNDFTNPEFWKETNNEKIVRTILKGRGMMPAFTFPSEDVKAVIAYISGSSDSVLYAPDPPSTNDASIVSLNHRQRR